MFRAVLHYVFVTAAVYAVRTRTDMPGNLCTPTTCGIGANCEPGQDDFGKVIAKCTCPRFSIGNPNVVCQEGVCKHNNDCLAHLSCDNHLCKDPCIRHGSSACAKFAACHVHNHESVCYCPRGYTGDPRRVCTYIEAACDEAMSNNESLTPDQQRQLADFLDVLRKTEATPAPSPSSGLGTLASLPGSILPNGRWMYGSDTTLSYFDGIEFCHQRNLRVFIPKSTKDDQDMESFRKLKELPWLWYPLTDLQTEGVFQWQDGTDVTNEDVYRIRRESVVYWNNGGVPNEDKSLIKTVYYYHYYDDNSESHDCGLLEYDRVWIDDCGRSDSAGIICT